MKMMPESGVRTTADLKPISSHGCHFAKDPHGKAPRVVLLEPETKDFLIDVFSDNLGNSLL